MVSAIVYALSVTSEESIRFRFQRLASSLDERALRLFAATEAEALGHGGISQVSRITGLAGDETRQDREGQVPWRMELHLPSCLTIAL